MPEKRYGARGALAVLRMTHHRHRAIAVARAARVERRLALEHVLVQHAGAQRTVSERTLEEARQRAEEARARLQAGDPVAVVARELSDGKGPPNIPRTAIKEFYDIFKRPYQ